MFVWLTCSMCMFFFFTALVLFFFFFCLLSPSVGAGHGIVGCVLAGVCVCACSQSECACVVLC